jgi:DNA-directed RNA polymerase specialized sigma subunit
MQIVPGQRSGRDIAVLKVDEAALRAVPDPWERARQANVLAEVLRRLSAAVLDVRRQAVLQLVVQQQVPQAQVARHLGMSGTRISQIVGPRRTATPVPKGVPA